MGKIPNIPTLTCLGSEERGKGGSLSSQDINYWISNSSTSPLLALVFASLLIKGGGGKVGLRYLTIPFFLFFLFIFFCQRNIWQICTTSWTKSQESQDGQLSGRSWADPPLPAEVQTKSHGVGLYIVEDPQIEGSRRFPSVGELCIFTGRATPSFSFHV